MQILSYPDEFSRKINNKASESNKNIYKLVLFHLSNTFFGSSQHLS